MSEIIPLRLIAREWTRIGLTGFGGPPAHVALLRRLVVDDRAWMDAAAFEDANAACGLLPGPASTQLSILCAYRVAGPAGALVGGLGFVLPAVVLVIVAASFVLAHAPPDWLRGAGAGAGAALAAVAVRAGLSLAAPSRSRSQSRGQNQNQNQSRSQSQGQSQSQSQSRAQPSRGARWWLYLIAGGVAAYAIGPYLVLVLLACGAAECILERQGPPTSPAGLMAAVPAHLATGGLGALAWTALKVGALSFGGGFVIIPLMQGDAVHVHHWMTGSQFLDAVALGQITPGPVVATVAAIGYAAAGVGGAILAAAVAFAPSFVFVLAGGSRFEQLRNSPGPRAFLDGAAPAAIGAILGAAVTLASALTQAWQFGLLAMAAVALLVLGRGIVLTLLGAAAVGIGAALAGLPLP